MALSESPRSVDTLLIRRSPSTVDLPNRGRHGAILHLRTRQYTTLTAETARLWAVLSSSEPTTARALTPHVSTEGLRRDISVLVTEWLRRGLVVPAEGDEDGLVS